MYDHRKRNVLFCLEPLWLLYIYHTTAPSNIAFDSQCPEKLGVKIKNIIYFFQPLVKFKSHLYYEDKDNIQESLNNLRPLPGSKIYFFKNGECQGQAFFDIYEGCYYPTVSLHKNVTVSVNFGPNFKYAPSSEYKYRPVSTLI